MDICFISFSNIVDDVRIAKEVKELIEAKYEVGGIGMLNMDSFNNPFKIEGVDLYYLHGYKNLNNSESFGYKINKNLFKIKHCFFTIKKLIELKPKSVHVCNVELLFTVYFVCKLLGIKIVYDSFEIWADMGRTISGNKLINIFIASISKKIIMFIEGYIVKRIDEFICVSHSMAEYFVVNYGVKKPVVVTNCPYSINENKLKNNDFFEVLYHGIYSPGRGIEELITSGSFLNNNIRITLRISYLGKKNYLKDLILLNDVEDRVIIKAPVPMTEVVNEASSSHVGAVFTLPINTNHIHTVSNKLFDYINAGIPVIMSNAREHIYLNSQYDFGIIVENLTPSNIADVILKLSMDTKLYNKLALNSKKAAVDLNWKSESIKLVNLYRALLKK